MSLPEKSSQVFLPVLREMVHSHMHSIKSLSAISYKKCNIRHAVERKYISKMSAIEVYD